MSSMLPVNEVLKQNPNHLCPDEIMQHIGVMEVTYINFDGAECLGQIALHHAAMSDVEAFFRHAYEMKFPIHSVVPAVVHGWSDEQLMADNISSAFNYRLIAGTDKPSLHGRGLAFDINPIQNPYIRYADSQEIVQPAGSQHDGLEPGTLHTDHPLVKLMEGFGWEWGGHWTPESGRIDYQHFQKVL